LRGSLVNADGTFDAKTIEQYAVNGKSFVINVPAGSAAVVNGAINLLVIGSLSH